MIFDTQTFFNYVRERTSSASPPDAHSLMDLLTYYYLIHNPIGPEVSSNIALSLEPVFKNLSRRKSRMILRAIDQTAFEYTNAAFKQGVLVGTRLILDLTLSENDCSS